MNKVKSLFLTDDFLEVLPTEYAFLHSHIGVINLYCTAHLVFRYIFNCSTCNNENCPSY
jgi:hypothetical protein